MQHEEKIRISVIIPTLNEEKHIKFILASLKKHQVKFETLIIDGGSKDRTIEIARENKVKILAIPDCGEFVSRNIGAKKANGEILLFTCADVVFPKGLLLRILEKFEANPKLIALTGPGHPFDAGFIGRVEYVVYNIIRFVLSKFPKPIKRFSTSTNLLAVRKQYFEKVGGFDVGEINADGLMGRKLLEAGEVSFSLDIYVYISARRMKNMGFLDFNKHYLYVFENLLFFLSNTKIMKNLKTRSKNRHRKIHEV